MRNPNKGAPCAFVFLNHSSGGCKSSEKTPIPGDVSGSVIQHSSAG